MRTAPRQRPPLEVPFIMVLAVIEAAARRLRESGVPEGLVQMFIRKALR